jgi:heme-degrading monooxygenase HmoA
MPKSPWKTFATVDVEREYLVLASSIPAKRVSSAPRMFRGAQAVRRQLAQAEGLVGFSLLAKPFSKQYATLSVWESQAALDAFVRQQPHADLMSALRPSMGDTRFVTWHVSGRDARPRWDDALERLRAPSP